jgi:hypothetical protein
LPDRDSQGEATILKVEKVFGLTCKEKRWGYPNHMTDSVHFKRRFYLRAAQFLNKIVSEKIASCYFFIKLTIIFQLTKIQNFLANYALELASTDFDKIYSRNGAF